MPLTPEQIAQLNSLNIPLVNQVIMGEQSFYFDQLRGITPPNPYLGTLLADLALAPTPADAGTRTLYVDPVNGSDDNDGTTQATALRTIQCAVLKYIPPMGGPPLWAYGDDRTISVVYTAGMGAIGEDVVIPPRRGLGALVIAADENVLFSDLIENGDLSAVAGKHVQQTLTFTTSPLTAGALAHAAFVRPPASVFAAASMPALEQVYDDLPIVGNTTGACTVVAAYPGVYSAINYSDGADLEIVAPQITWSGAPIERSTDFNSTAPVITNFGSPLVVRGFILKTSDDEQQTKQRDLLCNVGASNTLYGTAVTFARCTIATGNGGTAWNAVCRGDAGLAGCIIGPSSVRALCSTSNLFVLNLDVEASGGDPQSFLVFEDSTGWIYGLNVGITAGWSVFLTSSHIYIDGDVDGGTVLIGNDSSLETSALSVINAGGSPAVQVGYTTGKAFGRASFLCYDGTSLTGSTGNTGVGCQIGVLSVAGVLSGTPTSSGTGGELKVGSASAATWASQSGGVTNAGLLARYN